MAVGERIRFFRNLKGMTQKALGILVGFPEKSADIRMAQYEAGSRSPKQDITEELAKVLDVSDMALEVPSVNNSLGLAHSLFVIEDLYGLQIQKIDDKICLTANKVPGSNYRTLSRFFEDWCRIREKYTNGEMTKDEYDHWRYNYPYGLIDDKDAKSISLELVSLAQQRQKVGKSSAWLQTVKKNYEEGPLTTEEIAKL